MLKFIKNEKKLRPISFAGKIKSKPCFCGFFEREVWGRCEQQDLVAYENWLKEL